MDGERKRISIERTRRAIGLAYDHMIVASDALVERAEAERDRLLASLLAFARRDPETGTKLCTGRPSPGCETCASGTWSCLFLNRNCTRDCFFCSQEKSVAFAPLEGTLGIRVDSPEDYVHLLREFGFRGVGIAGGEPFLEFAELLRYVRTVKEAMGSEVYVWVYTNGDLVGPEGLRSLAAAGLDELRMNLSARDYDLAPLRLAVEHLRTVTVEIPAIPDDFERVEALLPSLQAMGVKHLHLHELQFSRNNYAAVVGRDYALLHRGDATPPVLGSEICALRLMAAACEAGPDFSVNYCSKSYKERFQRRASRLRAASLRPRDPEERPEEGAVTAAGFVRRIRIEADRSRLASLAERLAAEGRGHAVVERPDGAAALFLAPSSLASACLEGQPVSVSYHVPSVRAARAGEGGGARFHAGEKGRSTTVELTCAQARVLFSDSRSVLEGVRAMEGAFDASPLEGLEYLRVGLEPYG